MIGLTIWLIKISIKLTVLCFIACAWLFWLLIAGTAMIVASARGNQRSVNQWQRSLSWKIPRL